MTKKTYVVVIVACIIFNTMHTIVDLEGQTFTNYDFTQHYGVDDLVKANFKDCTITNCNFTGLNLSGANFSGATMVAQGSDASGDQAGEEGVTDFSNTNFISVCFDGATLQAEGGKGSDTNSEANGGSATIQFSNANLTNAHFDSVTITVQGGIRGVTVGHRRAAGGDATIDFTQALLIDTDFSNATLQAPLISSNSRGWATIDFSNNSTIQNINLSNVRWETKVGGMIDLSRGNFTNANFKGSTFTMSGNAVNFQYGDFIHANFSHTVFNLTNYANSQWTGANLSYANFNNARFNLEETCVIYMINGGDGERAINFSYTNFSGATGLEKIQFNYTGSDPVTVSFDNTIFLNTPIPIPSDLNPQGYTGTPITSETAELVAIINNHIPDIDLSDLNLHDFNFTGLHLVGANLTGTILTGCDLSNVHLEKVIGFNQTDYRGRNLTVQGSIQTLPSYFYLHTARNGNFVPLVQHGYIFS